MFDERKNPDGEATTLDQILLGLRRGQIGAAPGDTTVDPGAAPANVDPGALSGPRLPSSPSAAPAAPGATIPPPVDPAIAGAPGASAALPSSPSSPQSVPQAPSPQASAPAYPTAPSIPSSNSGSFLDRIMNEQSQLRDLLAKGPTARPLTKSEMLAGIIMAGAEGWSKANPAAGLAAAKTIYDRPQDLAEKEWQRRVQTGETVIRGDVAAENLRSQEAERTAAAGERTESANYRKFQMEGGPEKKKLEVEAADRKEKADKLRAAGVDPKLAAEFEATGNLRRMDPQNEAELALAAVQRGPDGKLTPEAVNAAAAMKMMRDTKIAEMRAARDPNEFLHAARDLQTNDVAVRGQLSSQLEKEQNTLSNPVTAPRDPAEKKQAEQRVADIQAHIKALDDDISAINESIRGNISGKKTPIGGAKKGGAGGEQDFGPAPAGKKENDTGTMSDGKGGTVKVIIKGGRIVLQPQTQPRQ